MAAGRAGLHQPTAVKDGLNRVVEADEPATGLDGPGGLIPGPPGKYAHAVLGGGSGSTTDNPADASDPVTAAEQGSVDACSESLVGTDWQTYRRIAVPVPGSKKCSRAVFTCTRASCPSASAVVGSIRATRVASDATSGLAVSD